MYFITYVLDTKRQGHKNTQICMFSIQLSVQFLILRSRYTTQIGGTGGQSQQQCNPTHSGAESLLQNFELDSPERLSGSPAPEHTGSVTY